MFVALQRLLSNIWQYKIFCGIVSAIKKKVAQNSLCSDIVKDSSSDDMNYDNTIQWIILLIKSFNIC